MHSLKFLIIFLFISSICTAQYNISLKINGLHNNDIYLAYYFGDKNYVVDTARVDENGRGIFTGQSRLDEGVYLIVMPSRNYVEIIIDSVQSFSLETDTSSDMREVIKKLKISGSLANIQFKEYRLFMMEKTKEVHFAKVNAMDKTLPEKKRRQALADIEKLEKQIQTHQTKIVKDYPDILLSKIIKSMESPVLPELGTEINGIAVDSLYQYNYLKDNYFANINFSDSRLLRTPVYQSVLERYFDNIVSPFHDSIISASAKLLKQIEANPEFMHYTLQYIFNKYSQSKIMGHDNVTVFLADNFYLNGKAHWVDSSFIIKLSERVEKIRPNTIGSTAPLLDKAQTVDGMFYPLHSIDSKYTVLIFWEPNCGFCKKEIPQLVEVFNRYHGKGLAVYAFYTQIDTAEWQKAVEDYNIEAWVNVYDPFYLTKFRDIYDIYSTPTIYLLDSKFKIIAKRVTIETVESILKNNFK